MSLRLAALLIAFSAAPAFAQEFKTVDANKDGAVTLEEAVAAGLQWNEDAIAGFDLDSNGVLSEEEFKGAVGG